MRTLISTIQIDLLFVIRRFPLPFICCVSLFMLLATILWSQGSTMVNFLHYRSIDALCYLFADMYRVMAVGEFYNYGTEYNHQFFIFKLSLLLGFGFFYSTAMTLCIEANSAYCKKAYWVGSLVFIFIATNIINLAMNFNFIPEVPFSIAPFLPLIYLSLASILFILVAPYITQFNDYSLLYFIFTLITKCVAATILTVISYINIFALFFVLSHFSEFFEYNFYSLCAIALLLHTIVIMPVIVMASIPAQFSYTKAENNRLYNWLYSKLPKIGYYISKVIPAVTVIIATIALSRIYHYGATEIRYIAVIMVIWCAITFLVSRRKNNRAIIYGCICAVIIMFSTAFGPVGIQEVATRSQLNRFEGMRADAPSDVDKNIALNQIADYIVSTRKIHDFLLRFVPSKAPLEQNGEFSTYAMLKSDALLELVNIRPMNVKMQEEAQKLSYDYKGDYRDIQTDSYDYSGEISVYNTEPIRFKDKSGKDIEINPSRIENGVETDNFTFADITDTNRLVFDLRKITTKTQWFNTENKELTPIILEAENDKMTIRLLVTQLYGDFDGENIKDIILYGKILIRMKN